MSLLRILIGAWIVCCWSLWGQAEFRPSMIVITADDLGLELGCYGDQQARSPNLDRLAAEGVRFTRGYVTQASCSSSRASILTGTYPHQHGQIGLTNGPYQVGKEIPRLPNLLRDSGYRTGIIGKLHVKAEGEPFQFDFSWGNQGNPAVTRDVREVATQVECFIKEANGNPFFLYLNYFDPHRPFNAEANQVKGIPENPVTAADVSPLPFVGLDFPAMMNDVAAYYNCIERLDTGIGILIQTLKKYDAYEDTLIIFLGDHGAPFARAKTTAYDAGVRVPFILRWPKTFDGGQIYESPVSSVDILPTLLEAAGVEIPKKVEGRSFQKQLIRGESKVYAFTEYTAHARAHYFPRRTVTDGEFHLILNLLSDVRNPVVPGPFRMPENSHALYPVFQRMLRPPEVELYRITDDPENFVNLADDKRFVEVRDKLLAVLNAWRVRTQDKTIDPNYLKQLTVEHLEN